MTAPRVDQLREPVVVGRKYLVPGVVYPWHESFRGYGDKSKWLWWPVLGPLHEDAHHLNFEHWHYHIDVRFTSVRQDHRAVDLYSDHIEYRLFRAISAHPLFTKGVPPHPPIEWRVKKCRRDRMIHAADFVPDKIGFHFHRMFAHYHGCEAKLNADGVRICPHKGAPLSGIAPDAQGFVTCPLHGLKFDRDLRSVRDGAP